MGATAPKASFQFGSVPALDGVRGIAILLVLLAHVRFGGLHLGGGFLGVDVFFVLSGFLITGLALQELDANGAFDFGAFYLRRGLRLLPALLAALLVVAVYAVVALPAAQRAAQLGYVAAAAAFSTNLGLASQSAATWPANLLNHTWSLGVEEQYYVLWPVTLVLLLAGGRVGARRTTWALLAVIGAVAAWRWHLSLEGRFLESYVGPDARMDQLLIGSLAALGLYWGWFRGARARESVLRSWPLVAGLLLLAVLAFQSQATDKVDLESPVFIVWSVGGGTFFAAGVAVLLLAAVVLPESALAGFLGLTALRWLGLISYGTYVWQGVLFGILDQRGMRPPGLLAVALALLLGTASYLVVERPFFALKSRVLRPQARLGSWPRTQVVEPR